jgi:hypothetical protein
MYEVIFVKLCVCNAMWSLEVKVNSVCLSAYFSAARGYVFAIPCGAVPPLYKTLLCDILLRSSAHYHVYLPLVIQVLTT